ncbi:aminopeptidase PaaP [Actinoallomurus acanthiterrae]
MRNLAIGGLVCLTATFLAPSAGATTPHLPDLVKLGDIRAHQKALQTIADQNGGNRAAGEPGFEKSVSYVVGRLKRAGYHPTIQDFTFPFYKENSPSVFGQTAPGTVDYAYKTDYRTLDYSGAGDVTATATAVDPGSTGTGSGCEADDFANFPKGNIALIQRGGCTFQVKAENAQQAGVGAAVVYQRPDVPDAPVEGQAGHAVSFPLIGTTNKIGVQLVQAAQAGGLKLHVKTDTTSEQRTAHNVLAETPGGSADNVIVAGAHLDSVIAGPGINDNGSGTATILTIAEQINKLGKGVKNKVRFAFWGAEEGGDLGSKYYVTSLSDTEKSKIALNLNFDMVGSPNGVRAVYDGDDSLGTGTKPPAGSGDIEKVFADYYGGRGLALKQDPFTASSDYQPFLDAGIPAGGVRSGTDGVKTPEEASVYGGEAGKAYDPCYHQSCDTYGNVNTTLLDQLADGAAHAVETFATGTTPVKADRSRGRTARSGGVRYPLG